MWEIPDQADYPICCTGIALWPVADHVFAGALRVSDDLPSASPMCSGVFYRFSLGALQQTSYDFDCVTVEQQRKAIAEQARQAEKRRQEEQAGRKERLAQELLVKQREEQERAGKVLTNSIGMKLTYVPAGEFAMGSPESEKDRSANENLQHRVQISKGFWMGRTEVTQGQYKAVMDSSPWSGKGYVQTSNNNAASYISWNDASAFCRNLSRQEGKTYRLPTEAEWEYACRAGTQTAYSFGDSSSSLGDYAWFASNAPDVVQKYAHEVGQKLPNAFGLHDMHGNVWEWCSDWYDGNYYSKSPSVDPQGPDTASSRVLRGGSWYVTPMYCRSADRFRLTPGLQNFNIGFRVVLLDLQ